MMSFEGEQSCSLIVQIWFAVVLAISSTSLPINAVDQALPRSRSWLAPAHVDAECEDLG